MTAGGVESTGNATDVAIQGNGWLRVANGNVGHDPADVRRHPVHPCR